MFLLWRRYFRKAKQSREEGKAERKWFVLVSDEVRGKLIIATAGAEIQLCVPWERRIQSLASYFYQVKSHRSLSTGEGQREKVNISEILFILLKFMHINKIDCCASKSNLYVL